MPVDKTQILHTIKIEGPTSFLFQPSGNPVVVHSGGLSVTHVVITVEEAKKIKGLAFLNGCTAEVWPMAGQNEEQSAIRKQRAGKADPERVWPTPMCPSCPWFDPKASGSPCGLQSWPQESVAELRRTSEHHGKAEEECPRDL